LPASPPTTGADVSISSSTLGTVTYTAASGALSINSLFVGLDIFAVTGGQLTVASTATFDEGLTVSNAGSLILAAGSTTSVGTNLTVSNLGLISIGGGGAIFNVGASGTGGPGNFTVASGGTLEFSGGTFTMGAGTLAGAGTTELSGSILELGSKAVTISGSFVQGSAVIDGTGTLTLAGGFSVLDGYSYAGETGSGTTLLTGASTVALGAITLDGGRVLENKATFTWTGGEIILGYNQFAPAVGGGTLKNDFGANLDIQGDGNFIGYGSGTTAFTNAGTITKSVTTGATHFYNAFTNTGTVSVQSGILEIDTGGSSSSGGFTIGSAGTLNFAAGTFTLGAITIGGTGTTKITGGTLETSGNAVTVNSGLVQNGGTIDGTGTLTLNGAVSFGSNGFTVETGKGTTLLAGTAMATDSGYLNLDNNRILENQGTFTWTGTTINLGYNPITDANLGGGTLQNDLGANLDIQADGAFILDSSGTTAFTNAGTITKSVTTGTTNFDNAFTNTGTVSVQSGILEIDTGGSSASGGFTVGSAGTLNFAAGTFALGAITIGGAGTTEITGGTLETSVNAVTVNSGFVQNGGAIDGTGTLTLEGAVSFGANGNTVETGAGTTLLAGTAMATDGGYLNLDNNRILENKGTFTWTGTTIFLGYNPITGASLGGGALKNDSGANLDLETNGQFLDAFSGTDIFTNAGTITESVATGATNLGMVLINTGMVSVLSGTLQIDGGGTSLSGAFTVGSAGTLDFSGGAFTLGAITIGGTGLTEVTGGALEIGGSAVTISGGFTQSDGAVDIGSGGMLTLSGTGNVLAGVISGAGTLALSGGSDAINGGATITTAALSIGGNALTLGASLSYAGALADAGTVALGSSNLTLSGAGSTLAGAVTGTGTLIFSGGSQALNNGVNLNGLSKWSLTGGVATLNTNLTYGGAFTEGSAATLGIASSDTLTLTRTSDGLAGTINGPGALALASGTTTYVSTLALGGGIAVKNSGTVSESGTVTVSSGSISNLAGANWNLTGNSGIALAAGGSGSFVNAGTLAKTAGAGSALVALSLTGAGSINVAAGTLGINGAANSIAGAIFGAGTISFGGGGATALNAGTAIGTTGGWIVTDAGTNVTLYLSMSSANAFTVQSRASVTLAAGKTLALTGAAIFNAGTIAGQGIFTTGGATSVNALGMTIGGTVTWQNNGMVTAPSSLTVGNNASLKATISNNVTGVYDITSNAGMILGGYKTSSFENAGLLEKTGGTGASHIAVGVTNTGTINVATQTLEFDGATNSFAGAIGGAGTLAFGGGGASTLASGLGLTVAAVSIVGASTKVTLGANLAYGGSFSQAAGTNVALGADTLGLGGTSTLAGAIFGSGGSTLALTGGAVTINAGFALTTSAWTIASGVTVTQNAGLSFAGAFTDGAASLDLGGKSLTLTGSASFTGSTIDGAGTFITKGATSVAGLTLGGGANWFSNGTTTESAQVTIGDVSGNKASITNNASGVWDIVADAGIAPIAGGSGVFNNVGLLEKTAGSGPSTIGIAVTNSKTITAASGTLDLAGAVTGTGTMNIAGGATLQSDSTVAATQIVAFGAGGGTLELTNANGFRGVISGFGSGDMIDLTGFPLGGTPKLTFVENAANTQGVLTIKDGTLTASLTLLGQSVSTGFAPGPDSGTGTAITYTPPPAPGLELATVHH
jgi:hypothetical protein